MCGAMLSCLIKFLEYHAMPAEQILLAQNATPVFLAAKNNHAEIVRMLVEHEADIAAQCNMVFVVSTAFALASVLMHHLCTLTCFHVGILTLSIATSYIYIYTVCICYVYAMYML